MYVLSLFVVSWIKTRFSLSKKDLSNMLPCSSGAQGLLCLVPFFLDNRQPRES